MADQLQSNFASDLRNILRTVFQLNSNCDDDDLSIEEAVEAQELSELTNETNTDFSDPCHSMSRSTTLESNQISSIRESEWTNRFNESIVSPETSSVPSTVLMPPIWVPDELVSVCTLCSLQFTFIRRKHHCRNCGQIFCNNCSSHFMPLLHYGFNKPVRVCNLCYHQPNQITVGN